MSGTIAIITRREGEEIHIDVPNSGKIKIRVMPQERASRHTLRIDANCKCQITRRE